MLASIPGVADEGHDVQADGESIGWEIQYYNRSDHNDPGGDTLVKFGAYVVCGS